MKRHALALGLSILLACEEPAWHTTISSVAPSPPPLVSGAPLSSAAVDDELSTKPLQILKFRFTSGIKNRDPVDKLEHAKPGERVYAHFAVRNRTGRKRQITVVFAIDGKEKTKVDLAIDQSWEWRTWAYNTVAATEKGTLTLSVTDDEGHPLLDEKLPIR
jgi:hypothetical protein